MVITAINGAFATRAAVSGKARPRMFRLASLSFSVHMLVPDWGCRRAGVTFERLNDDDCEQKDKAAEATNKK